MQVIYFCTVMILLELNAIKVVYYNDRQNVHSVRDHLHAPETPCVLTILTDCSKLKVEP